MHHEGGLEGAPIAPGRGDATGAQPPKRCFAPVPVLQCWQRAPGIVHPVPGTAFPANKEPSQLLPTLGGGPQLPCTEQAAGTRVQHPQGCVLRVLGAGTFCCPLFAFPPLPNAGKGLSEVPSPLPASANRAQVVPWQLQPPPILLGSYKCPRLQLAKRQEPHGEGGRDGRQLQRGADGGGTSGKEHPSLGP